MLPHIRGRPVTMERYPSRHRPRRASSRRTCRKDSPSWLERVEVPKKGGTVHHPLVNDAPIAALDGQPELHHAARLDLARAATSTTRTSACSISIRRRTSRRGLRAAALALRDLLAELGLRELGEDVRLERLSHRRAARRHGADRARSRTSRTSSAPRSSRRDPEHLTQEFSKADRGGRILRRHRTQRLQRHLRGAVRRAREARRAGVRARARGRRSSAAASGRRSFTLRTVPARVRRSAISGATLCTPRRHRCVTRAVD